MKEKVQSTMRRMKMVRRRRQAFGDEDAMSYLSSLPPSPLGIDAPSAPMALPAPTPMEEIEAPPTQ